MWVSRTEKLSKSGRVSAISDQYSNSMYVRRPANVTFI